MAQTLTRSKNTVHHFYIAMTPIIAMIAAATDPDIAKAELGLGAGVAGTGAASMSRSLAV
eukprot:CAMPEP_0201872700 /NCGR_PEP_ID=MMETSP0902-20130614/5364_1 /ASSEMBLY_ACC=CAM_ASM_000551 /TAXON_ID=420261 /ORGANISM="Thalassiosira antarctica, Strain CCMP982" /LENGTH=59 /DNA_ID=CAMNT_0048399069 /DNA_START=70 /DNA_END=246 /DNA_ORIENTATION=+